MEFVRTSTRLFLPEVVRYKMEGRSPLWRPTRHKHLVLFPTCAACGTKKQLEVHHILPFQYYPELELQLVNLMTLCEYHGCHLRVGHCYNWKAYNRHAIEDAARELQRIAERITTRLAA